jgi:predicted DNA-binding transcriptional regulator AlpA
MAHTASRDDRCATAAQVRSRYGNISDMTLWRWLQDANLRFPKPLTINGRRYWKISDLEAWEISQTSNEGRQ